jgi:hypothetical protein
LDDENVVIYQGDDGSLWARRHAEFSDGRFEEIEALTPRHEAPASEGQRLTAEQAWADLLENADRNLPEDSPMLLVTWEEMADYMNRAQPQSCAVHADAKHEAPAEGAGEVDLAARALLDACYKADENSDLSDFVDGMLLTRLDKALRARSSAPEAREEALGNLLAVIHGDGGHRALEVGTKQAALEAEKIVAGLFAAPSADKLREVCQDVINQMADNIEKLALTPAKRELVKAAFRACIGRISTPDALKGDAK